jgi:uncharacterized protein
MEQQSDIFVVPILDKYLLHAPLHDVVALVDLKAIRQIQDGLRSDHTIIDSTLQPIVARLRQPAQLRPQVNTGPITDPFFLGLIPTRGCNMGCPYCDFSAPKKNNDVMDLRLAREAVDVYMSILVENDHNQAEVHFFGGEPFYAPDVVHFVVGYATIRAAELNLDVRFEATSNGLYNTARAEWIADYFDTVVLSLDGPADIQDRNRPGLNGRSVFEEVVRTAQIFSERPIELILRSCITKDSVSRMPEMAGWIARDFRPSTWCVETLTASPLNESAGLELPDPWEFARNFDIAARILDQYGIEMINSTTDIRRRQQTFCPVGRDALIVSPDGSVDACYLLKKDWSRNGLNMRYGQIYLSGATDQKNKATIPLQQVDSETRHARARLQIDDNALQSVRSLNVYNRLLCTNCMCRYHCAGGCHVNHDTSAAPGMFDDLCIHTRLISIANLLKEIGQYDLVTEWFSNRPAMEASVWQMTDRMSSIEFV